MRAEGHCKCDRPADEGPSEQEVDCEHCTGLVVRAGDGDNRRAEVDADKDEDHQKDENEACRPVHFASHGFSHW